MDPFAVLGIERRYDVDLIALEKRHRELSRALHPDRYAGAGVAERRLTLAKAIEVNEAWRQVRDPIARAEALFSLAGVAVGERNEPPPSPALLMEAMDRREALADAKAKRDLAAIDHLAGEVDARRREIEEKLGAGFARGGDLHGLVSLLGELRFHRRLLDEVSAIEDALAEAAVAQA
ncbi:MAG: Fe-S protein assembly co-chaperone HscB [Polyangiaceae bacterium]|jgi:molecular chaperone HscB